MNNLVVPPKLQKGDTIGFVSPSAGLAPFAMHRIERAKSALENLGFIIKIAKNALKNDGYVSASIENRVSDIHEMFLDSEVKLVMCTIGGNHSNQLLKYLDYELIRNNPKIFVGYSDITVLHYAIQSQAGLSTFYGPCAMTQFGEFPKVFDYTVDYFEKVVVQNLKEIVVRPSETWTDDASKNWFTADDLKGPRQENRNNGYMWVRGGKASGKIAGGCIPSINHLLGTKYWIDPIHSIFFVDIPEGNKLGEGLSLSDFDSYCSDLDNNNVFDNIKGLVIGRPYHYSEDDFRAMIEIILKYTSKKEYPILANANLGHTDPIITLPYHAIATLDSDSNNFTLST